MPNSDLGKLANGPVLRVMNEALGLSEAERTLLLILLKPLYRPNDADSVRMEARRLEHARQGAGYLTPREREVAALVIGGATNKEMADHLRISRHTVEAHRGRALDKLGAESTADFIRLATTLGMGPTFIRVRNSPD